MKRTKWALFVASLLLGAGAVAASVQAAPAVETKADETTSYPRGGYSNSVMYIRISTEALGGYDLAVYFWNNSNQEAWSERVHTRMYNGAIPVSLPKYNGNSVTWNKYIICRYDTNMEPSVSGWSGARGQSRDLSFGDMLYAHNTVNVSGWNGESLVVANEGYLSTMNHYGVRAEKHVYLDLKDFPDWETADAKFALFFASPNTTNSAMWGTACSPNEEYVPSFCWKVQGQSGNEHLYECIAPNIFDNGGSNIWATVIEPPLSKMFGAMHT